MIRRTNLHVRKASALSLVTEQLLVGHTFTQFVKLINHVPRECLMKLAIQAVVHPLASHQSPHVTILQSVVSWTVWALQKFKIKHCINVSKTNLINLSLISGTPLPACVDTRSTCTPADCDNNPAEALVNCANTCNNCDGRLLFCNTFKNSEVGFVVRLQMLRLIQRRITVQIVSNSSILV